MYPMNSYIIVEEVKTEDTSPAGDGVVLYRPPADSLVRTYKVLNAQDGSDLKYYDKVYAKVQDVIELPNGKLAVKYQDLIAKEEK